MAFIDVEDLIGKSFDICNDDDTVSKLTVIDAIKNHQDDIDENSTHTKFRLKYNKDKYEEILTYNEHKDHLNNLEDGAVMWELQQIVSHRGSLKKTHPSYNG